MVLPYCAILCARWEGFSVLHLFPVPPHTVRSDTTSCMSWLPRVDLHSCQSKMNVISTCWVHAATQLHIHTRHPIKIEPLKRNNLPLCSCWGGCDAKFYQNLPCGSDGPQSWVRYYSLENSTGVLQALNNMEACLCLINHDNVFSSTSM